MTQVWPGLGIAPVPTVLSMICKPEGVVMVFPAVWADAPDGAARRKAPAMAITTAIEKLRNWKRRIFSASFITGKQSHTDMVRSIPERAAVLARIGTAGQRALVPVDPDRL